MNKPQALLSCIALAVLQTACTTPARIQLSEASTTAAKHNQDDWQQGSTLTTESSGPVNTAADNAPGAQPKEAQARIYEGSGVVINPPPRGNILKGDAGEFNFEEAPIAEVIHVMMGDILQADYVLHQPIEGSLTLSTRKTISKDRAMSLLETALMANGLHIAQDSNGFYHIGKPESLRGIVPVPRQVGNGPLQPGYGAILIPLEYIAASEMAEILKPVMQEESLIRVDSVRNMLVLAGTRPQAEGWMQLVKTFDVDLLKGMSVGIFPLKYASIADIQAGFQMLSAMSSSTATGGATSTTAAQPQDRPQQPPGGGRFAAQQAAAATATASPQIMPFLGSIRIMPLERLNSIMVVTPRAEHLQQMREWLDRLDQPNESTEPQLFVYGVENGSAAHLAQVLSGIFGGSNSSGTSQVSSGVAPGLNTTQTSSSGFGSNSFGSNSSSGGGLSLNSGSGGSGQSHTTQNTAPVAMDLGGVRVIADPLNNAILVWGSRLEYEKIEATLRKLDRPPVQVVLEASIVEVTLTNDLQYGLRWAFNGRLGGSQYQGNGGSSGISGLTPATALAAAAGLTDGGAGAFSYAVTKGESVNAILGMLASRSLVKMLSSPSLLVLDNHTASITVGDQVPVRTGTIERLDGEAVTSSIQYKDTGVILKVTPSVNSGDMVTLSVDQAVTNVGENSDSTGNPTFMQRQISSKVAVRSGEPVVLGGLIRENSSQGKDGIPGLVDVPVLGNAFGATKNNVNRTELLVILTPSVVRSGDELRSAGVELKERMQTLLRTRIEEIRKGGPVLPGEESLINLIPNEQVETQLQSTPSN